jgi:hypothetical protein
MITALVFIALIIVLILSMTSLSYKRTDRQYFDDIYNIRRNYPTPPPYPSYQRESLFSRISGIISIIGALTAIFVLSVEYNFFEKKPENNNNIMIINSTEAARSELKTIRNDLKGKLDSAEYNKILIRIDSVEININKINSANE